MNRPAVSGLLPVLFALAAFPCLGPCLGQEAKPPAAEKPKEPSEEGYPVADTLVVSKCGGCHAKDEKGNLTRISWERTTPEGWQQAIKRMVRLHGVELTPEEARQIVRYLSNRHGLAPEEARPVMYVAERRMIDETVPDESLKEACVICHSAGRPMSWRRSREEWDLLLNMHIGYFPVAEFQGFRRFPRRQNAPPQPPGTDTRHPGDKAVDFLTKSYPLRTPEWSAWLAGMRAGKLAGRWLLTGAQPGPGRVVGEVEIEATAQPDEFVTTTRLTWLKDGRTVTGKGRAIVYTGYAWRGRIEGVDGGTEPGNLKEARQVMMVSRDQSQIEGRWFWGGYDEFGIDVTLRRAGNDPVLFGVDRTALRAGAAGQRVRIHGSNLPSDVKADEIEFGSGITVKRVLADPAPSAGGLAVEVDVAAGAIPGKRDLAVRRHALTGALAVYDKIDYLKVTPEAAMARLGGTTHPKGYQQFEAIACTRGPDNKIQTADDIELGPVEDIHWSIEEFLAVYGDDDKEFVGSLSQGGLFTPAREGPNPQRKFSRNNYGDVWVVATWRPAGGEAARDGKPATGRAHLVVTIPLYVRWDQPEVAQ